MSRNRTLSLVGLVVLIGAVGVPVHALSAASAAGSSLVRPASLAPHVPNDATRLGRLDPSQSVTFDVTLPPSHQQELTSLLRGMYDPSSQQYQQWLAPGDFARRFGPSPTEVDAVVGWLHRIGLPDAHLVNGRVEVHATARLASDALSVSFARYRSTTGVESFAPDRAPMVPRAIAPDITSIVGLSDTAHLQPHLEIRSAPGSMHPSALPHASSCGSSITQQANGLGGWTSRQVAAKYQVRPLLTAGLTGAGKTIAIYELAPHAPADTSEYLACFGLHNTVTTKPVSGGAPNNNPGGVVEANLDIEDAAATAPGAKIISYEGPNTALGSIRVWSAIVNDDKAQVVSTSWGLCEAVQSAGDRTALHAAFTQAAAQGQTIFAASGDSGSEDCLASNGSAGLNVDSPANEPLVTAVGGTSLLPNLAVTNSNHEPVWNDCAASVSSGFGCGGGAGGGGLSRVYRKPAWQPTAGSSTCQPGCREVPDLSANAGIGEAFVSGGLWMLVGGTSIASPKLAGIAADIVEGCVDRLGPFNHKVYSLAHHNGIYGVALRDVPAGQGDNDLTRTHGHSYPTTNGFDLATGMGTPLASGLACPEVTHVVPARAAAGAHVTITGLALARATVRFGSAPAKVLARSTTSMTVIVPNGSGHVQVGSSDSMGKGTLHAPFAYRAG